jgi:hypothetical protein
VIHEKTKEENWMTDGRARRHQAGAHRRSDAAPKLAPTRALADMAPEDEVDLTHLSRKVKEVILAAGLRAWE